MMVPILGGRAGDLGNAKKIRTSKKNQSQVTEKFGELKKTPGLKDLNKKGVLIANREDNSLGGKPPTGQRH